MHIQEAITHAIQSQEICGKVILFAKGKEEMFDKKIANTVCFLSYSASTW